ncbi:auxin-responsive protein IAA33 [Brachypodium distachyon]|uniref:Auxin-responsive protein n=1 Tax=Brachypodium distachyon TaxID=15368 RepID=I1J2Q8_BRADI|nr:auxin-responsive protein IAA33 [Brachypodium distachyon]KQJ85021.1 hypothetical protein BRADI_5g24380v3 [Brachypodium distachyon]|eukprot:XP_024311432.1 auxin-responsive protein IAA33 [Brachypodium distachyon]
MMSGNANGSGPSGSGTGFFQQQQQHPKRRPPPAPGGPSSDQQQQNRKVLRLSTTPQGQEDALAAGVVPPVTVVLGDRCISHRVHLGRHSGYRSLAAALRRMFVDEDEDDGNTAAADVEGQGGALVDLSNAVPGHVVAYEDMEDDLLLAGDLNWRDFVRVAKRIRILPKKSSNGRTTTTKQCGGGAAR